MPAWSQRSHVFTCLAWRGEPEESEEIVPQWFALDDVPYARMWDDAARWLPDVLRGGRIRASYTFGDDLATVVAEDRRSVA
jgi:8-oxo-dGTP diphosphatase